MDKNNNNNNEEENKEDNDFINPFKDFNFKNGTNPYEDKSFNVYRQNNNEQNLNNINNINDNNINNDNDFSNPFLNNNDDNINNNNNINNINNINNNINNNNINNNNINNNKFSDDNDFSNPFKDAFGYNENNNNNLNNNFELRQNQNNNQNNDNIYSNPNKGNNPYNAQYNNNFGNNNYNNKNYYQTNNFNNNNYYRPNNMYNQNNFNNNNNNYYHPNNVNNNNNNYYNPNNFKNNNNNNNYYNPNNFNNNNDNFNNNNHNYYKPNKLNSNNDNNDNYYNPNKLNNNNDKENNTNNNNINNDNDNNKDNQNNSEQKNNNDIPFIKNIEVKNEKSTEDYKKIEAIIKKCESLYNTAKTNYLNYFVRESIATLKKIITTLESVKQTITTQKSELSFFLPKIETQENLSSSTLNSILLSFYELINIKYKSINLPMTNSKEVLDEVCSKFILTPFIAFDDIFDTGNMKDNFCQIMKGANARQSKCILLYGGKGEGKTLLVHGYARKIGANVIQLEGTDFLKVPFFAAEFGKICVKNSSFNRPLFVYIKNIEQMIPCMTQLNFIYDKVASSFKLNIYFIASTSLDLRNLNKNIYNKFQYYLEVKGVAQKDKPEYLRFICDKVGIKLNINLIEFNDFVNNYLGSFSNKKIFELIKLAINLKKEKTMQNEDPNWIYKEGLNIKDLKNAISNISPYL